MDDLPDTASEAVITIPDPGLALGTTYYISAKAKNGADAWSEVGNSDGIQLAPAVETIADAKALADGSAGCAVQQDSHGQLPGQLLHRGSEQNLGHNGSLGRRVTTQARW